MNSTKRACSTSLNCNRPSDRRATLAQYVPKAYIKPRNSDVSCYLKTEILNGFKPTLSYGLNLPNRLSLKEGSAYDQFRLSLKTDFSRDSFSNTMIAGALIKIFKNNKQKPSLGRISELKYSGKSINNYSKRKTHIIDSVTPSKKHLNIVKPFNYGGTLKKYESLEANILDRNTKLLVDLTKEYSNKKMFQSLGQNNKPRSSTPLVIKPKGIGSLPSSENVKPCIDKSFKMPKSKAKCQTRGSSVLDESKLSFSKSKILNNVNGQLIVDLFQAIEKEAKKEAQEEKSSFDSHLFGCMTAFKDLVKSLNGVKSAAVKFVSLTTVTLYVYSNIATNKALTKKIRSALSIIYQSMLAILSIALSASEELKADKLYWMLLELLYKQDIDPFSLLNDNIKADISRYNKRLCIFLDFTIVELFNRDIAIKVQKLIKNLPEPDFLELYKQLNGILSVNDPKTEISEIMVNMTFESEVKPVSILSIEQHYILPSRAENEPCYTLVLDLDETLVHYQDAETEGKLLIRPFAIDFINTISAFFEIVIFTAGTKSYASQVIDLLDPYGLISHRLYREHTKYEDGVHLKDLSILGRPISHVVIVDNIPENFKLHKENGIYIKSWYGHPQDDALYRLAHMLKNLVEDQPDDLRLALGDANIGQIN